MALGIVARDFDAAIRRYGDDDIKDVSLGVPHELLNLRLGRLTLLTGDVLPEDLSALFGDRVASRLTAGRMLEIADVDRRRRSASNGE